MTAQVDTGAAARTVQTNPTSWSWGMFPMLALTAAAGVAAVAAGNIGAHSGAWWSELAFYGGLLLIGLPIAVRLLMPAAEGTERVSLVVLLAVALFLCKVVHEPTSFGAFDEFLHWRTAQDIDITGRVFTPNALLGVSPYYPGLELVGTALSEMTGISIFDAGLITLVAARIVFLMSLFFLFSMVSGSTRVAGIACLIYMTNPKFLYFNSQFSYESLALPLAALVMYVVARRGHSGPARWLGLSVIAFMAIAAVVTTHHVTSLMLAAFLVLWGLVAFFLRRRERSHPGRMGALAVVMIAAWTLLVATATIGYLAPALTSSVGEILRLIAGEADPRQLFVTQGGDVAPLWERLVGSASAGLIIALLPFGLFVVLRRYRTNPPVVALALAATLFPLTLVARLTRVGAEVSARTPEFLYVGIGLVIALALVRLGYSGRLRRIQMTAVTAIVAILLVGGVIVGIPGWARLPGPYLVSADSRSIEPEGIAAATWARDVLGPGQVFVADRVNRILMATFGQQSLVTTYETRLPVRQLYLAKEIGAAQRTIVRLGGIKYLVVDRRLTTAPPVVGHYFDRGERALLGPPDKPLDPQILAKFDRDADVSRIFDSGNIQLYDVSALAAPTPP
jgi:hypothetical protein